MTLNYGEVLRPKSQLSINNKKTPSVKPRGPHLRHVGRKGLEGDEAFNSDGHAIFFMAYASRAAHA